MSLAFILQKRQYDKNLPNVSEIFENADDDNNLADSISCRRRRFFSISSGSYSSIKMSVS